MPKLIVTAQCLNYREFIEFFKSMVGGDPKERNIEAQHILNLIKNWMCSSCERGCVFHGPSSDIKKFNYGYSVNWVRKATNPDITEIYEIEIPPESLLQERSEKFRLKFEIRQIEDAKLSYAKLDISSKWVGAIAMVPSAGCLAFLLQGRTIEAKELEFELLSQELMREQQQREFDGFSYEIDQSEQSYHRNDYKKLKKISFSNLIPDDDDKVVLYDGKSMSDVTLEYMENACSML